MHDLGSSWRAPTLYPGVFVARSGAAVGRVDGIQRGPSGLRFTLTVWPGTPQRPEVVLQPWDDGEDAVRGFLRVIADGQEYTLPAAQVRAGAGEHDVPEVWTGPVESTRRGRHLWLHGHGTSDTDGSFTSWPELRPTPESVRRLEVTLVVAELAVELAWTIDLDEPAYTATEDAVPVETLAERTRFSRPTLLSNIEIAETDLAIGRLDSFSLAHGALSFRQTVWAHPDTVGLLCMDDLWFEREEGPAGHFDVTVGGRTHRGANGRGRSARLTMRDAHRSKDRISVDWGLVLNGVCKDAYLAQPIACELVDPVTRVEMRWAFQLQPAP